MGLFTGKQGLSESEKQAKFAAALFEQGWSKEQLDAVALMKSYGLDVSNVSLDDFTTYGQDTKDSTAHLDFNTSGLLSARQDILDNTNVDDIKTSVGNIADSQRGDGEFGFQSDITLGKAQAGLQALIDNNISPIEQSGDRYLLTDTGADPKAQIDAAIGAGLLPDISWGYETHRSKDGKIALSVDEPEDTLTERLFKAAAHTIHEDKETED